MYRLRHSLRLFVLLLTVCLGVSGRLFGQYYPIHATVQWPAPQSPYLADYSTGSRDRLIVTLLNRDLQQPLLYAKLRLQIKSGSFTARSREEVSYPQLELQTSVPLRLTGIDLSPYLQPQHLQMTGRLEQGRLPSGYAELQLQVIDYYTGRPLSDWHTARAYLDVKEPPFLNLPERDAEVVLRDPLFLRFQWTPRHQGLSGTEYEFVLKELPDNGAAPQSAFAYGQEIFRTHTRSTSLSYTHLDPPLLPNRRYAWQVRALVRSGVEEVGMFEHGGLSEVSWFYLNDQCDAPRELRAQTRYAKVDLSWGKVVGTTGYVVECRPKTKLNVYEWARTETAEERLTLAQLKPGWTYEWRVGTRCTSDRPVFSDVREFTLSKQNEALVADCGKEPVRTDLRGEPHLGIRAGDVVTIGGDYPMTITEVTALGDGWYSGKGKTRLKTLIDAPIALRFDRLRINVDKYQIDGSVEASYDEKRGTIANTDYIDDGGRDLRPATLRLREKQLSFTLPESPQFHFDAGTGTLTVQDAAGNAQRIDLQLPEGEVYKSVFPLLVTDKEGNSYRIQPAVASTEDNHDTPSTHGKVALQSERVERMGDFDSEALSKKYGQIRFSGQGGRYAFDPGSEPWYQKSVKLDRFYKPFTKDYIAPWKLIPEGAQDVVTAEYTGNKAIDPQRVRFASEPRSMALPASYDASSKRWSVSLPSVSSGESYEVFAVYEGEVLGKLRVASYAQQRHKLTLVPINDAKLDKAQIERELNGVYGSVGIRFDVEVDERMRGDYSWDRDGDRKLSIVGKSFFGRVREVKESAEMDYLKKAYSQLSGTLDGLYLFVVDAAQGLEDKPQSLLGEMPRRSRFGYIFSGNSPNGGTSDLGYTIAHELGHGLFTLQHTFDDEYGGRKSQGQTDNLMDYATGKELAAFQWNILANPAVFTALDRGKDAHFASGAVLTPNLDLVRIAGTRTLYVSDVYGSNLVQGTLPGLRLLLSDDTKEYYAWDGSCYRSTSSGKSYTIKSEAYTDVPIYLFYNLDKDCGKKAYVLVNYSDLSEVLKLKKNKQIDAAKRALLSLIHEKEISSEVVVCIDSTKSPAKGAWTEQSVPLDCSSEDIVALQKSYQDHLKTKLRGDIQELVSLLKQYRNEPCFFEHISIDVRLEILSKLIRSDIDDSVWEFSFGKLSLGDRFFLDKLVLSTPKIDRLRLLRDGFMANQGKWIEIIFNKSKGFFNNDVTIADILPLVTGLASWIKEYYKELNIPISLGTIQNIGYPDLNEYSYPIASITPIYIGVPNDGSGAYYTQQSDSGYTYELSLRSAFEGRLDSGRAIVSQKFLGHLVGTYLTSPGTSIPGKRLFNTELNLNLFEPVILLASRDYSALGIKAREEYVVPAFLAVIYQQLLNDKASWDKVRSAGNYLAIGAAALASPYTGGGSWAAYTTIGAGFVAGIDEALKDGRLKLGSSTEYDAKHKDFYQAWENLYNTAMVADAVANAPQLIRAIRQVNLIYRAKQLCEISRAGSKKFFEYLSSLRSITSEGFEKLYQQYEIIKLTTKIEAPFIFNPKIAPHISNALGKADLKRIIKWNAKAALGAITPEEMKELQNLCRIHFPVPKSGEKLRKVITLGDVNQFHLSLNAEEKVIFGFLSKAEDYTIPSSSEELIEYLRLDYTGSPFRKENGFAVIEFPCPPNIKIIHPFEDVSVVKKSIAPYTNTGMSGSQKTIIPEYYAQEKIKLPEGSFLFLYDATGNITKKYVLTKLDLEKFIWVEI